MVTADEQPTPIAGLHHVTAIAGPPRENLDFYTGVLGLRLVKKTVNFDDPTTYHLYYGDELGRPGSILTFFPWAHVLPGRLGTGITVATALSVPSGSVDAWTRWLASRAYDFEAPQERLGAPTLVLRDPHGLVIELIEDDEVQTVRGWSGGPVPEELVPRRFHGATLGVADHEGTARLLTRTFGYTTESEEEVAGGRRVRLRSIGDGEAGVIDLLHLDGSTQGRMGAGSVHHVAFRAKDEEDQLAWREKLLTDGLQVTPVVDRQYFKSIYFREPSGILFEIATDPPGFTLDEAVEELGSGLRLPPWLERQRAWIEERLPELEVDPGAGGACSGDVG